MKKHPIMRFIIEAACLLLIITLILLRQKQIPKVEGWTDFKKGALTNYTFVRDVECTFSMPPEPFYISYVVNREVYKDEAESIIKYTQDYLQSQKVVDSFRQYYTFKDGGSLYSIGIRLFYHEGNTLSIYAIWSGLETDNAFHTWHDGGNTMYTTKYYK